MGGGSLLLWDCGTLACDPEQGQPCVRVWPEAEGRLFNFIVMASLEVLQVVRLVLLGLVMVTISKLHVWLVPYWHFSCLLPDPLNMSAKQALSRFSGENQGPWSWASGLTPGEGRASSVPSSRRQPRRQALP